MKASHGILRTGVGNASQPYLHAGAKPRGMEHRYSEGGRQLSCGRWDRLLIPEMWDCLITSRLVAAATGLGVKGRI